MGTTARFPFGVTNVNRSAVMGLYGALDPAKFGELYVDFTGLDYVATQWTATETDAASTQGLIAADATGEFGLLALVQAGTGATAVNSIQLTTAQMFLGNTAKRWWMKGRISRDNADEAMGIGVQAVNATPFTLANGIFASIAAAATAVTFAIGKAAATTTASVAAAYPASALNTFIELGMAYNGRDKIDCFIDGAKRAEITTLTNLPNTVALLLTVASQNSTAAARSVHCDNILFAVER